MDNKFRVEDDDDEMLLLPAYMKNIRRVVIILAVLLLYISMYLIHNAYGGALCIIKSADDSKAGDNDAQEASRLLYKVNDGNLFAVSNVQFLCCRCCAAFCQSHFWFCN